MNHDELLAKIQASRADYNYVTPHNALRAVVDLHKPEDESPKCRVCQQGYPCPTIEIIEKELA